MLPNWLLGKSKSKLQEILGGGGGGTDYTAGDGIDISDGVISFDPATTPAIDPSKIDGLDDGLTALTPKSAISNPNILHNPWFQVNQRGETSTSSNGYFVDRWRTLGATTGTTTYTLNSDGTITIDNSLGETHAYIIQRRTSKTISRVTGRKITASVMLSDGTVHSGSGTYVDTETTNYYEDDDIKIQSIAQSSGQFFVLRVEAGKTITIKALKLEVGEISTLAMDTAPDMATELLKCQRYYQRFKANSENTIISIGGANTTTSGIFTIFLPAAMRSTPTLTSSGGFTAVVVSSNNSNTGTTLVLNTLLNNILQLTANWNGSANAGQIIALRLGNNSYIEFSAEL